VTSNRKDHIMLSKTTVRLLEEIAARYGERRQQLVREDPEAALVSLLLAIKGELPEVSATLFSTVETGFFRQKRDEAKRLLAAEGEETSTK